MPFVLRYPRIKRESWWSTPNPMQPVPAAAAAAVVVVAAAAAAAPAVAVLLVPIVLLRHLPHRPRSIVPVNRYGATPLFWVERVRRCPIPVSYTHLTLPTIYSV